MGPTREIADDAGGFSAERSVHLRMGEKIRMRMEDDLLQSASEERTVRVVVVGHLYYAEFRIPNLTIRALLSLPLHACSYTQNTESAPSSSLSYFA
jgi:hypothetical protein